MPAPEKLDFIHRVQFYNLIKKFVVMDFHWCSEVPGGQDNPIELVRGLEDSRKFLG